MLGIGINAVGAMPRDRSHLGNQMVKEALEREPDFIEIVEADDIDVMRLLPHRHWHVAHRPGPNQDGVLLAARKDVLRMRDVHWRLGAPASPVNDPRPILSAELVRLKAEHGRQVAVCHRPKKGGEEAAEMMDDQLHALRPDHWYSDQNRRAEAVRREFPGYKVVGDGVVFAAAKRGINFGIVRSFDVLKGRTDDDHRGLMFRLDI